MTVCGPAPESFQWKLQGVRSSTTVQERLDAPRQHSQFWHNQRLMSEADNVHAARAQFTTTHWSVVLAAGDSAAPNAQPALEHLCRAYWYPLYAFLRRLGHSPAAAKDLT